MSNVSFSLTEKLIINPVLTLRVAPLNTNPLTLKERVGYFLQSEVVTRVIALATSLFAAADAPVLLVIGIIKGAHLGLRKLGIRCLSPAPSGGEVAHYFKQSAKFLGIALIGSVVAAVWPDVVKYFKAGPGGTSGGDWTNTSEAVQNLWSQAANKNTFKKLWNQASIDDRRTFVRLLDEDNSGEGLRAQSELVDIVYRKITHPSEQWPKQKDDPVFYHATSKQGLEGILKTGRIEVRHEKAYRGAFVSTQPEMGFGKYVLVFNRNIERLSHLNHGFAMGNAYWAGFSHDITVNATTLRCILVHNGDHGEVSELKTSCTAWTGREIKVKELPTSSQISGDKDIPKEWPGFDPNTPAIWQTMQIRAQQAQKAQKAVSVCTQEYCVQNQQQRQRRQARVHVQQVQTY